MTTRSVVLSGLWPVERVPAKGGILSSDTSPKARVLCVAAFDGTDSRFFTKDLSTQSGVPRMSLGETENMLQGLASFGAIYLTADTFTTLVLQTRVLNESQVAGVFPWPAEHPCKEMPRIDQRGMDIARSAARYYWRLQNHPVMDHDGRVRTFQYRAANTVSYRAYAPYHHLDRSLRVKMRPANPQAKVLQFDWKAAEWSLILQYLGYTHGDDAYEAFLSQGIERDFTKLMVLAYIYGATSERLGTMAAEAGRSYADVERVISVLDTTYPLTLEWRRKCRQDREAEFCGFHYDLGESPHARPNHFAQTALQLCKWDLLYRLDLAGLSDLGCGDLHDQLLFDVEPGQQDQAAKLVETIRQPCFGRYHLRPELKLMNSWGES